jgi:NADPH-dependent 2,4-dienoyl-CoA reductase/sulfur reductase-like enzyme
MRYVIIGNSAAGIGAVEGIRSVDLDGEITLIADEPHHTYSRPLISYLLLKKVDEEKMKYRADGFYAQRRATLLAPARAEKIEAGRVCLSDGREVPYDKLLVATGSRAFVPPFEGLSGGQTFMNLDDARQLEASLGADKRVLIIGAGLIGLKCAEGIVKRVKQVTVADLAPRVLSSVLDEDSARLVQARLEANGIALRLGAVVEKFDGQAAVLRGGERIPYDILVLAVGVRPNTELLQGVAEIDRGALIDERCQTSAANIYAAGDVAQAFDASSGQKKIMALLPNAYMQGECAGVNMAGGDKTFDRAIPMNAVSFFGLHIITAGLYEGEVYEETGPERLKRLFYADNRLKGYILVGDVEKAGIYTSLIRERTPLDTIDFPLIARTPGLMAFAGDERRAKLGGATK